MSKRNMLLGLAGGKVGDLVFYRDGGEQRTRTRVIPKNPRSPKQMAQRVRIANVSALYRLLAPIVRNSFSNRPGNQSGYNAMASGAIELSPFMTKEMANADAVLPMPAVIAKGVLQGVDVMADVSGSNAPGLVIPSLATGSSVTMGQVSSALLADYPALQEGDKVTIVVLGFEADSSFDFDLYKGVPYFKEFVIDSADATPVASVGGLGVETGNLLITGATSIAGGSELRAVAAVVSRVDGNGALQTSFARLELTDSAQALYEDYRTEAALSDALRSYTGGSVQLLR